ncbi:MAG: hypothetical protein KatS3mg052_1925 [Candidatus Roseilinea sp.]|nr:MAG: hypothetical protein KatS3mg052_1925 [Candidatus Roseilinea sp.]
MSEFEKNLNQRVSACWLLKFAQRPCRTGADFGVLILVEENGSQRLRRFGRGDFAEDDDSFETVLKVLIGKRAADELHADGLPGSCKTSGGFEPHVDVFAVVFDAGEEGQ